MNTSSRRAATRKARQLTRKELLTNQEFEKHPEACRRFTIFGGSLEGRISEMMAESLTTKRKQRYDRMTRIRIKKNKEAYERLMEDRKKHKESMANRMKKVAMRALRIRRQQG